MPARSSAKAATRPHMPPPMTTTSLTGCRSGAAGRHDPVRRRVVQEGEILAHAPSSSQGRGRSQRAVRSAAMSLCHGRNHRRCLSAVPGLAPSDAACSMARAIGNDRRGLGLPADPDLVAGSWATSPGWTSAFRIAAVADLDQSEVWLPLKMRWRILPGIGCRSVGSRVEQWIASGRSTT